VRAVKEEHDGAGAGDDEQVAQVPDGAMTVTKPELKPLALSRPKPLNRVYHS
jgi:hypothetical protein